MKSYIEPLNAADALDVLYAHGIPFGDISYSRDNDEDAVLHGPGGDKVLRTPDDVIAALGDDAARALAEHKRFRERAVRELMVPVLSDGESIYNVRTGDTFILDSNCEGKLYGFDYTVTPLATLVDEGEDGIPYGAGVYAIETYGADMGHIDDLPDGECPDPLTLHSTVEDDDLSYSVASVLRSMERTALELEAGGDLFDLSGWTLANGKSIAATCARLGIDIAPKLHTDPASVADAARRAAGTKVSAVYVPVGDLPRETTVFPDMARAAASIGLEDPETETLAEYGGVTVSLVRAADAEGSELKPNRAWARGGATEIVRGGFLVIATDGDGEVVDLPKWAIESAKTRFADPSTGPFQASAEFMREVRRGLGEQIEQAGRTPSDIAALASQLAAKPGDDGGAGGKRI